MLQVQEIDLLKLHPWEDNPRLNDHAVDAVADNKTAEVIKIRDNTSYTQFDQYLKHLIDTLCAKYGFTNRVLNWYRGA